MATNLLGLWLVSFFFISGPFVAATSHATCKDEGLLVGEARSSVLLQKQQVAPALMQALASESVQGCGPSQSVSISEAGTTLNSKLAPETKNLGFIFIPQNDGKRIEALGRQWGVNWGSNAISNPELLKLQMSEHEVCAWNLVPPRFLAGVKVYADKTLFCVTRDPAERLLSTYLSIIKLLDAECPIAPADYELFTRFEKCTPESLNYFAVAALRNRTEFAFDCNLIPQHKYIWDWDGEQVCDEIIRFKNLGTALPTLLSKYNISAPAAQPSLLEISKEEEQNPCPGLTSEAFDADATLAIRDYYHQDYVSLGFN